MDEWGGVWGKLSAPKVPVRLGDLLHDAHHEGWNEHDVPRLKLKEIQFLCRCLGAPHSGTKEKISIRLLAVRQVRLKLAKFGEVDIDSTVAEFPKVELKHMAREAGLWRSGNKRQLAAVLLGWRNRARHAGETFLNEQIVLTNQIRARREVETLALSL